MVDKKYKELLFKFYANPEIYELIDLVILDSIREREEYYLAHKSYPQDRDLISKLKSDLNTIKAYVQSKNSLT